MYAPAIHKTNFSVQIFSMAGVIMSWQRYQRFSSNNNLIFSLQLSFVCSFIWILLPGHLFIIQQKLETVRMLWSFIPVVFAFLDGLDFSNRHRILEFLVFSSSKILGLEIQKLEPEILVFQRHLQVNIHQLSFFHECFQNPFLYQTINWNSLFIFQLSFPSPG